MIGSVPLGLIMTQFLESIIILIPSEVSDCGYSSFNDKIIFLVSSEEHGILSLVVKDNGNLEISSENELSVVAKNQALMPNSYTHLELDYVYQT